MHQIMAKLNGNTITTRTPNNSTKTQAVESTTKTPIGNSPHKATTLKTRDRKLVRKSTRTRECLIGQ
jgi:hypothetical protein